MLKGSFVILMFLGSITSQILAVINGSAVWFIVGLVLLVLAVLTRRQLVIQPSENFYDQQLSGPTKAILITLIALPLMYWLYTIA